MVQGGAPAHYALCVRDFLDEEFPGRWIAWRGPIDCSARSSDLTPAGFFLWGSIKGIDCATQVQTLPALKEAIVAAIQNLQVDSCQLVCRSVPERLQLRKNMNGGQTEQVL